MKHYTSQDEAALRRAESFRAAVPHALSPKQNSSQLDPAELERRIVRMMPRAAAGLPLFAADARPSIWTD